MSKILDADILKMSPAELRQEIRTMRKAFRKEGFMKMTDKEFMEWATKFKPCRYCGEKFTGPVCPCERRK